MLYAPGNTVRGLINAPEPYGKDCNMEHDLRIFQSSDLEKMQTQIAVYLDAHSAAGWQPMRVNEVVTPNGVVVFVYVIRPTEGDTNAVPKS